MKPESKEKWIKVVEAEIARREITIESTRQARNSADSPMTSRYDTQRDIFNNDLNINLDAWEADKLFLEEIKNSGETHIVKPGAVVMLDFGDNDTEQVLFMNNYGSLPDIQVVTSKSPLGAAINNLKINDSGSYSLEDRKFVVKIKAVE